jgi:hypothetical protein
MASSNTKKTKLFIDKHFTLDIFKDLGWLPIDAKRIPYAAMAQKICWFMGFKTVFEYGRFANEDVIVCYGVEGDISGMDSGGADLIHPTNDSHDPLKWQELIPPDMIDMQLEERFLN